MTLLPPFFRVVMVIVSSFHLLRFLVGTKKFLVRTITDSPSICKKNAPSYDGALLDAIALRKEDLHQRFDVIIGLPTDQKVWLDPEASKKLT